MVRFPWSWVYLVADHPCPYLIHLSASGSGPTYQQLASSVVFAEASWKQCQRAHVATSLDQLPLGEYVQYVRIPVVLHCSLRHLCCHHPILLHHHIPTKLCRHANHVGIAEKHPVLCLLSIF